MIEVTSFLLKHLYEFMADNYAVDAPTEDARRQQQQQRQQDCVFGFFSLSLHRQASSAGPTDPNGRSNEQRPSSGCQDGPVLETDSEMAPRSTTGGQQSSDPALLDLSLDLDQLDTFNLDDLETRLANSSSSTSSSHELSRNEREQETNQQIVSFLTYNQLPDLACETFIELLFICVFLAISWIFVMIIQLHYYQPLLLASGGGGGGGQPATRQQYQSARQFYCNTRLLNSLMYCNNREARQLAS